MKKILLILLLSSLSTFAQDIIIQESPKNQNVDVVDENRIYKKEYLDEQAQITSDPSGYINLFLEKFKIPKEATKNLGGTKISLVISFIVEKDGTLTNYEVHSDPGYGLGNEAIKTLKKMPPWIAGKKNGIPVRSYSNLPLKLEL